MFALNRSTGQYVYMGTSYRPRRQNSVTVSNKARALGQSATSPSKQRASSSSPKEFRQTKASNPKTMKQTKATNPKQYDLQILGEMIQHQSEMMQQQGEIMQQQGEILQQQGEKIQQQGEMIQQQGEMIQHQGELLESHIKTTSTNHEQTVQSIEGLNRAVSDFGKTQQTVSGLVEEYVRQKANLKKSKLVVNCDDLANLLDGSLPGIDASFALGLGALLSEASLFCKFMEVLLANLPKVELSPLGTIALGNFYDSIQHVRSINTTSLSKRQVRRMQKALGTLQQELRISDKKQDAYYNKYFSHIFDHFEAINNDKLPQHLRQSQSSLAVALLAANLRDLTTVDLRDQSILRLALELDAETSVDDKTPGTLSVMCHEIKSSGTSAKAARYQLTVALKIIEAAWNLRYRKGNAPCTLQLIGDVLIPDFDAFNENKSKPTTHNGILFITRRM